MDSLLFLDGENERERAEGKSAIDLSQLGALYVDKILDAERASGVNTKASNRPSWFGSVKHKKNLPHLYFEGDLAEALADLKGNLNNL